MLATESFEAVGLGLCAWDRLLLFDRYPGPDRKVQALASAASGGGPVPTALAIFSKLGGRAAMIGAIGDDPEGELIRRDLDKFAINTAFLKNRSQKRSPCAYIWIDRRNGKRTVALDPGDADPIRHDELPADLIRQTPLLLIDGRETEACLEAAKLCRAGGGLVVLDAGSPRARIEELLAITDHEIVSLDFVRGTFPKLKPGEALREIQALGPTAVVVTCGRRGGYWLENDRSGHYPSFPINVVDTTGAGDAFHGAYLFGLRCGWKMEIRCRFAAGVAALVCRGLGGRVTAPDYQEAIKFIEYTE